MHLNKQVGKTEGRLFVRDVSLRGRSSNIAGGTEVKPNIKGKRLSAHLTLQKTFS